MTFLSSFPPQNENIGQPNLHEKVFKRIGWIGLFEDREDERGLEEATKFGGLLSGFLCDKYLLFFLLFFHVIPAGVTTNAGQKSWHLNGSIKVGSYSSIQYHSSVKKVIFVDSSSETKIVTIGSGETALCSSCLSFPQIESLFLRPNAIWWLAQTTRDSSFFITSLCQEGLSGDSYFYRLKRFRSPLLRLFFYRLSCAAFFPRNLWQLCRV